MTARHDWRINPQEPSLEPVETGEDFAAEEAAENGIPDAEELHDDAGRGWHPPQAEASGELARYRHDIDDGDYCLGIRSDDAGDLVKFSDVQALLAARPAPTDEKALFSAWFTQLYPKIKTALNKALANLPQRDMGTTYDEDVRLECREALATLGRMREALAREAPKEGA